MLSCNLKKKQDFKSQFEEIVASIQSMTSHLHKYIFLSLASSVDFGLPLTPFKARDKSLLSQPSANLEVAFACHISVIRMPAPRIRLCLRDLQMILCAQVFLMKGQPQSTPGWLLNCTFLGSIEKGQSVRCINEHMVSYFPGLLNQFVQLCLEAFSILPEAMQT